MGLAARPWPTTIPSPEPRLHALSLLSPGWRPRLAGDAVAVRVMLRPVSRLTPSCRGQAQGACRGAVGDGSNVLDHRDGRPRRPNDQGPVRAGRGDGDGRRHEEERGNAPPHQPALEGARQPLEAAPQGAGALLRVWPLVNTPAMQQSAHAAQDYAAGSSGSSDGTTRRTPAEGSEPGIVSLDHRASLGARREHRRRLVRTRGRP